MHVKHEEVCTDGWQVELSGQCNGLQVDRLVPQTTCPLGLEEALVAPIRSKCNVKLNKQARHERNALELELQLIVVSFFFFLWARWRSSHEAHSVPKFTPSQFSPEFTSERTTCPAEYVLPSCLECFYTCSWSLFLRLVHMKRGRRRLPSVCKCV